MWSRILLLAAASTALLIGADDGWGKVKALGSGTELRVTKIGARFGIVSSLQEVTDESIIVTTKTEQLSILKEQIARIEFIPAQAASRMTRSTSHNPLPVDGEAARQKPGPARTPGPASSSATTYTRAGKPNYEVLWSRPRGN